MPRLRFLEYSYYRAKIGQTYYVCDPRHAHQHPEVFDEELGHDNEDQAKPRLRAGKDGEPYCIRWTLLVFFIAIALIAAYLFRLVRPYEFDFEFFDAMVLAVVIVAVIGAIATFYRNAFLLGLISFILVCIGGFFMFFLLAASYFYLFDEVRFRKFAPISRDLLKEESTPANELLKAYMTIVAFCLVHAAAFFMIAVFSHKLRARCA